MKQTEYIHSLDSKLNKGTEKLQQLTETEHHQFRQLVGAMMWIVCSTRPDFMVDVVMLANHLNHPLQQHAITANKIIRGLKGTSHQSITYKNVPSKHQILTYGDASHANLPNGGTQGGHTIMIAPDGCLSQPGNMTNVGLIAWRSARLKRVVHDTFTGELLEEIETFDRGVWIARLYKEFTKIAIPVDMLTDCQSVVDNTRSLKISTTSKRNIVDVHEIREALENGEIRSLSHVSNTEMVADGLTKTRHSLKQPLIDLTYGSLQVPHIDQTEQTLRKRPKGKYKTKAGSVLRQIEHTEQSNLNPTTNEHNT
jgi:hypothetical protein